MSNLNIPIELSVCVKQSGSALFTAWNSNWELDTIVKSHTHTEWKWEKKQINKHTAYCWVSAKWGRMEILID